MIVMRGVGGSFANCSENSIHTVSESGGGKLTVAFLRRTNRGSSDSLSPPPPCDLYNEALFSTFVRFAVTKPVLTERNTF